MEAVKDALSDGVGVTEVLYVNSYASFFTECCLVQYRKFLLECSYIRCLCKQSGLNTTHLIDKDVFK